MSSWFTDIAGRAENLLNKVDKSAAVALQKSKEADDARRSALHAETSEQVLLATPSRHLLTPSSSSSSSSSSSTTGLRTIREPSLPKTKVNQKEEEERLLDFLNSPAPMATKAAVPANLPPATSSLQQLPPVQELAPDVSQPDPVCEIIEVDKDFTEDTVIISEELLNEELGPPEPEISLKEALEVVNIPDEAPALAVNVVPNETKPLKQENEWLRQELVNVKCALQAFQKSSVEEQGEKRRLQKKLEHWTSQVSESDSLLRELQGRESDMKGLLSAKDSQLAVLRVRLQEADQETAALKNKLQESQSTLEEQTSFNSLQQQSLDSLRSKLQEAEAALRGEQQERTRAHRESQESLSQKEEEVSVLTQDLVISQKNLQQLRGQNRDLVQQLSTNRQVLEGVQEELSQYRIKAQRILHSKEKLITALKERNGSGEELLEESFHMVDPPGVLDLEADREALREELAQSQALGMALRQELVASEQSLALEAQVQEEQMQALKDRLRTEEQKRREAQAEGQQNAEELRYLREDLTRTKSSLQARLKDRDLEIEKLRKQVTAKSLSQQQSLNGSQQRELEGRLKNLTENLIQKQTLVEALSTEKNSLSMQMEVMERKLKELQGSSVKGPTHVVGISVDGLKERLPSVFTESPYDGTVARRVKRAYSALDAFSIRTGSFLRRYPAGRAFLLLYMALLHLWVMIVLCTYQPEIHSALEEKNRTLR